MADVRVKTEGLAELRRDFERLGPLVGRETDESIEEGRRRVAVTAAGLAPRVSGALAADIRPTGTGVGSTLPYAGWIERGGTIRPRGEPITIRGAEMVGRAVEDHADQIVEDIADGVDRAAYRAGWHPGR